MSNNINMPISRPRITRTELEVKLVPFKIDQKKYSLVIGGIRGYYLNSMGEPSQNDRGIWDDAICLLTDKVFVAFNGNTDPSKYRIGHGTGADKGMASLVPGCWYAYHFGYHHAGKPNQYPALIQTAGPVTVIRDGNPDYQDNGYFGINIHHGGAGTSSEGCQTIPLAQWPEFYGVAEREAKRLFGKRWRTTVIPYALFEEGK